MIVPSPPAFERIEPKFHNARVERQALGGRVFDILGEVFQEKSLREMLIEAIRFGDDPERQASLFRQVEGALDTERLREILARTALCQEVMTEERLFAVRAEMEKAEARKLQPYFVRAFFSKAFQSLGGELRPREAGRYEIPHVPAVVRERDRRISGRERSLPQPVMRRYERVCFEKEHVHLRFKPMASLLHPGHPLMQAVTDIILEQHRAKLRQGAVLVDPHDLGMIPRALFIVDHSVRDGARPDSHRALSRRMQFVSIDPVGNAVHAGWAPNLDLEPIAAEGLGQVRDVLDAPWITNDLEQVALGYASRQLVPEHYDEVRLRREREVEKTLQAVHERLVKEINFWSERYIKVQEDVSAGRQPLVQLENIRRTIDDLTARLDRRTTELKNMRHVVSAKPNIVGGALIIPAGLLAERQGQPVVGADAAARSRIERAAMQAVMEAERALGHQVFDVSAEKCGWDVTSRPPAQDGRYATDRHIEVKGRAKGQSTVTVSRNEILYGLNQADKFILALVFVDGEALEGPYYVRQPFSREPDWATISENLDVDHLMARAVSPEQSLFLISKNG